MSASRPTALTGAWLAMAERAGGVAELHRSFAREDRSRGRQWRVGIVQARQRLEWAREAFAMSADAA